MTWTSSAIYLANFRLFDSFIPGITFWSRNGDNKIYTDEEMDALRARYVSKQAHVTQLTESPFVKPEKGSRHCGYCLKVVAFKEAKMCGGCSKRAYCSKECQRNDWTSKDGGQNHKYWCKLGSCQEDIEWEVAPVSGKGLGIIAKTFIPVNTRVIMEGTRQPNDQGILDLMPRNGTVFQKMNLNAIRMDNNPNFCGVFLRTSRFNHSCDNNLKYSYEVEIDSLIVYSVRDIHPGEELEIHYRDVLEEGEEGSQCLVEKWNIICSPDCVCKDQQRVNLFQEMKQLDVYLESFVEDTSGRSFPKVEMDRYLQLIDLTHSGAPSKGRALLMASTILMHCEKSMSVLPQIAEFFAQSRELAYAIGCPQGLAWREMMECEATPMI